ncbi:NAD(P)/FAD-dependent oxidoreductase [Stigmatella aurantiaca]|uniref:NADH dehydrogenase n=1 Tax=Stigmatella aurantiaca (strain DW4/3-1) TaxID=378806 RepID=Q08TA1_STIAD|nr:FAD-dependent oxidoreductase [Stigmatella aurantiaca]ADO68759.1 NADH dehydrogenase II [Stigmatella aurantiaca DW4/3-1]EAU63698.1 NADH dehydrogenase [Stigmatella aurantiaca DW4/3-1]
MRVVILGGGYGGLVCALRLARRAGGQVAITLVSEKEHFVERIRLHEWAAGHKPVQQSLKAMVADTGITFKQGRVTQIDPQGEVLVGQERLPFDRLVVALGSQADTRSVPGIREHAFTLEPASAAQLASMLPGLAARGGRVVVVGGGLTGIESATEFAEAYPGLKVSLLSSSGLGKDFQETGRKHLLACLDRLRITQEQGRVKQIHANAIELADRTVPFDVCLWTGGFTVPALLRESGLPVNERGQVLVDPFLHVIGHKNILAVGDAAMMVDPPSAMDMGCKTALPMGAHAAENLARIIRGEPEQRLDYVHSVFCTSLGRKDGIIQFFRKDGSMVPWVVTGRPAAWIKEFICRSTLLAPQLERVDVSGTVWRKKSQPTSSLEPSGREILGV